MKTTFALIGAAGYVAPKHMQAIREIGGDLVAAFDPHDSVGILDSYFPDCHFFTEFERFDRHLEKLKRKGCKVDYLSVCSPNYLHDAHIRFGLRYGADVICEKPMVLNPWNVDAIAELEAESNNRVHNILQLRLHPAVVALKNQVVRSESADKRYSVKLEYITPRGNWYHHSWKGDVKKSGGIATNIGIHFFDMLLWVFGAVKESHVEFQNHQKAKGFLQLEQAEVEWFLSLDRNDLPKGKSTHRFLCIDNKAFDFTTGFEDLHTKSYQQILSGQGFSVPETSPSIAFVHAIRQ